MTLPENKTGIFTLALTYSLSFSVQLLYIKGQFLVTVHSMNIKLKKFYNEASSCILKEYSIILFNILKFNLNILFLISNLHAIRNPGMRNKL
jgi:hypothetical protein